jgi:hypothetical protein
MKKQLAIVAFVASSALGFAGGGYAQQKSSPRAQQMEAVVTVTKVDPASRVVHVRTKTRQAELRLAPDIDMSNIKEGSRYQIRWTEATATAIEPRAQTAGAGGTRQADVERTRPGAGVATAQRAGVVEKVDTANKRLTLRTLEGETETFRLGEGVSAESLKPGEAVTVTYQRALVSQLRSTPQPVTDPYAPQ